MHVQIWIIVQASVFIDTHSEHNRFEEFISGTIPLLIEVYLMRQRLLFEQ